MKNTLTIIDLRIIEICRDIELLSEQLYRYFADLFPENKEVSTLWAKTADEEANHAQQFVLAIRNKKEMLESVSIDARTVAAAFKLVNSILAGAKKNPPSLAEAIQIGVKLEECLANLHLEYIAGFAEESLKMLFRAMMACDNRHLELLHDALRKYSKPVLNPR